MATKPKSTLLAMDPGTNNFGFSVLRPSLSQGKTHRKCTVEILEQGLLLATMRSLTDQERLQQERLAFEKEVDDLIAKYQVTSIVLERYMLRRGSGGSAIEAINQMIGVLLTKGLPLKMIPASQWKNALSREENNLEEVYAAVKPERITPHQVDAIHIGHWFIRHKLDKLEGPTSFSSFVDPSQIMNTPTTIRGVSTQIKKKKKKKRAKKS